MSEITAKFEIGSPIGLAAAKEDSRYRMSRVGVYPVAEKIGIAVATDGKVLAATTVNTELLNGPTFIPGKFASKPGSFALNGEWRREQKQGRGRVKVEVSDPCDEGRFPPFKSVLKEASTNDPGIVITLDAELLQRVQSALGANALTMFIPADTKSAVRIVAVDSLTGADGVGAVMPITRDGSATRKERLEGRERFVARFNGVRGLMPENANPEPKSEE
jgi:hypothetical protein